MGSTGGAFGSTGAGGGAFGSAGAGAGAGGAGEAGGAGVAVVVPGGGGTGSAIAKVDGRAIVAALAAVTAVTASAAHRPGRRLFESGGVMAMNLPCYSRDASVACSRCGVPRLCGELTNRAVIPGQRTAGRTAVCSATAVLQMEELNYDPAEVPVDLQGFRQSSACKGLQLADNECDSIHMYWNGVKRRMDWWRL